MSIAIAVKHMLAAGMGADAIVAAVAEMEAAQPKPRSSAAIRQERYRRNKASRVTESGVCDAPLCPPLVSPIPPSELPPISPTSSLRSDVAPEPTSPKKEKVKRPNEREAARQALALFVSDENAEALVRHREAIGHPLTGHAATLLGRQLLKIPDPDEGAEMILLHGWRGFKAEWYENAKRQSQIPLTNGVRKNGH